MKLDLSNAQIDKIATMQDGTIRLVIGLPELPPEKMTEIFMARNEGVVTIELDVEAGETKTPSARLRGALWVLWEQEYKMKYPEFETFYKTQMEKLVNKIKDKLN